MGSIDRVCHEAKKVPGVGTYEPAIKPIKPRILGTYKFQDAKSAFTGEAEYKGLLSPPFHNL